MGEAIEAAWRAAARFDAWHEHLDAGRWWQALAEAGVEIDEVLHRAHETDESLPWDHIGIRQGREWLVEEWGAVGRGQ